jgi:hypothetical protein
MMMKPLTTAAAYVAASSSGAFGFVPARSTSQIEMKLSLEKSSFSSGDGSKTRRHFIANASILLPSIFTHSQPALGVYGADAKMVIPDVMQGISDRTNKQCLVESLGNRECLVYLDPENKLYKGSDGKILFDRLVSSVSAMKDIPSYIELKQWNNVQTTMTGKMGTLSSTMNELSKLIEDDAVQSKCKSLSVDIRNDLYEIAGSCSRKDQAGAAKSYDRALLKLEKFIALVNGS